MKHVITGLLALGIAVSASSTLADSLDVNMHSKALRATYTLDLAERGRPGLSAEFGLLYSNDDKRLDDTLVHAGMHVSGENWSESGTFDIRLGGRLIHTSPGNVDLVALAPGAQVRFSPIHRVGFGGHLYYAPGITSFRDANRYREYGVRADYQLLPQAFVYVGFRYIDVDIDGRRSGVKLEDNYHVGMKVLF